MSTHEVSESGVHFEMTGATPAASGWPKRPCLWLRKGSALYPLMYLQKAKWLTDEQFTAVLDGLKLSLPASLASTLLDDQPDKDEEEG